MDTQTRDEAIQERERKIRGCKGITPRDVRRFICEIRNAESISDDSYVYDSLRAQVAALARRAKRSRRNATRRAYDDARRSCGLVKTPYGWE
jgi:hypothetical protein